MHSHDRKKLFDPHRIADKIVLILAVFITALVILSVTLITQNNSTLNELNDVRSLRIPIPILTAEIMSGANRVSASQRAYMMSGDEKFKEERLYVWEQQIKPAAEGLAKLNDLIKDQQQVKSIDQILQLLVRYEIVQGKIDVFFEEKVKDFTSKLSAKDSSNKAYLIEKLHSKEMLDLELTTMITKEASFLRKEIRDILRPLNQAQQEALIHNSQIVEKNIAFTNYTLYLVSGISLSIILLLSFLLIRRLKKSIKKPTMLLTKLAKGEVEESEQHSKDELNEIIQAANKLGQNLKKASEFAIHIGEGKFDHDFKPSGDKDLLGNSLIQMHDQLKKVAEEDRKSNWKNTGIAQFGNILRKESLEEKQLFDEVIGFIVKYLEANQGAIFLVNEEGENKTLDLAACYAYGRKKYITEKFTPGEGLVGQVYKEQSTALLKKVPDRYVKITSGLGEATAGCIMASPIIFNKESFGVIEIASFETFKDYQVEFIENICYQLATTISKVRVNTRTQNLLEASQKQAQTLARQEEELRQNLEELSDTQEEMRRKDIEMSGQLNAIDNTMAAVEFTLDGIIISANQLFLDTLDYTLEEIKGKHHRIFVSDECVESEVYKKFWNDLSNGIAQTGEFQRIGRGGKKIWFSASYSPILNSDNIPYKIIKFAQDITEQKLKSVDFEGQVNAINNSMAAVEFNLDSTITNANKLFLNTMGYTKEEIMGLHHRIFTSLDYSNSNEYAKFWRDLNNGLPQTGEFIRFGKNKKQVWLHASYTPILNEKGKPYKIIKFAQDITEQKLQSKEHKLLVFQKKQIEDQKEEIETQSRNLLELNNSLEEQVKKRTVELQKKNEKLSEYAFINAHKLRAPLANIKGLVSLFDMETGFNAKGEVIEKIKESANNLDTVVTGIRKMLEEENSN